MSQQLNSQRSRAQSFQQPPQQARAPTSIPALHNTATEERQASAQSSLLPDPSIPSRVTDVDVDIFRGFTDSLPQADQASTASQNQALMTNQARASDAGFSHHNVGPFQNQVTTSPLPRPSSSSLSQSPLEQTNEQSHGTLVISHTGRSKYLGPTAASEWLKDVCAVRAFSRRLTNLQQEIDALHDTPTASRPGSPGPGQTGRPANQAQHGIFSFLGSRNTPSVSSLMLSLPNPEEAEVLIDSYYRYFGWS
jgi:hypothetical protein